MENSNQGRPRPGQEALADLDWEPDLSARVLGLWLLWQMKPELGPGVYAAFEALSITGRVVEAEAGQELEPSPDATVQIPWWVLKVLAMGWENYRADPGDRSLGQVLGLERGKGQRRLFKQYDRLHRDLMLTLDVVHLRELTKDSDHPLSVDAAIDQVSSRNGIGRETLWKIYKKHRPQITARYEATVSKTRL